MCMEVDRHTHLRYDRDMRTNIEIDDKLMATAFKLSDLKTKKAIVQAALEEFVDLRTANKAILATLRTMTPDDFDPAFLADYEAHRVR
ncbi:MAG: Bacterial antitoxin of type system, VapB [Thermoleophilia bacterium]|nr:Bacterial antitoxin of type system, VapB [Thermoleophilia bacterium]